MTSITAYVNTLSQPCRTVLFALKKLGLEFEQKELHFPKDIKAKEYVTKVNPLGKVPAIEIDGTPITESSVIVKYLFDKFDPNEVLLPRTDLLKRVKVEEFLDISGTHIRPAFTKALFPIVFGPKMMGLKAPSKETVEELTNGVHKALKDLESFLDGNKYVTGDDFTIADAQLYFEAQNVITFMKIDLKDYPNIVAWNELVGSDSAIEEVDKNFYELLESKK